MKITSIVVSLALVSTPSFPAEIEVSRPDGSRIHSSLFAPSEKSKAPILLYIDGSTCTPSLSSSDGDWLIEKQKTGKFGLLVVEKPGLTFAPGKSYIVDEKFKCPDEFKAYYAIDQRVMDQLAIIAFLRANPPKWWNGKISIWGFSDGAHIGAQTAALAPEVASTALISGAGAIPMRVWLRDMMCPSGKSDPSCGQNFDSQTNKIFSDPSPNKTWLGDSNTYKAWRSRLNITETAPLQVTKSRVLVVQGEKDRQVSPESGLALSSALQELGSKFEYRQIPAMKHGIGSLDAASATRLRTQVLYWLTTNKASTQKSN